MRRKIIPYNPKLKELARRFRNNPTEGERKLWQHLKGKQMLGYDFDRQKPLDQFIVDFFCYDLMLAIEINGDFHFDEQGRVERDKKRQQRVEKLGIRFLRFSDDDVTLNIDGVLEVIENWIIENIRN
jgi:very-short-patch-repair endonuclease